MQPNYTKPTKRYNTRLHVVSLCGVKPLAISMNSKIGTNLRQFSSQNTNLLPAHQSGKNY